MTEYCATNYTGFYQDFLEAQTTSNLKPTQELLILNNQHNNKSKCYKIELIVPMVSYENYIWTTVSVDHYNYQHFYSPEGFFPTGTDFEERHIVIEVSKKQNSYNDEKERILVLVGGGQVNYTNTWYLKHDGYLITIALPDYIVFNNEEELRQYFTFETQVIRECEVCKAAAE